jgi:hypothetical protein
MVSMHANDDGSGAWTPPGGDGDGRPPYASAAAWVLPSTVAASSVAAASRATGPDLASLIFYFLKIDFFIGPMVTINIIFSVG